MFSLENQVALITGASRGIGKATAIMLAELGADIFVHYNKSYEGAKSVAEEVERLGRKAYLVRADVADHEQVKNMFAQVTKGTGKLDILVNNAGVVRLNYLRAMTEEQWDEVIDTNLKGAFLCSKYAVRFMMKEGKGCIVNVSSIAAIKVGVTQANYASSKGGLIAMTQSLARELGSLNIRVNAVAPGPIRTDMNFMSEEEERRVNTFIPLGRIGEGEDVAKAIAYLCSPISEYVTGQVLRVDGGMTL